MHANMQAEALKMEALKWEERRADERVAARFEVQFSRVEDAARALWAYSLNLSAGGLCLRTRRSLDVGQLVRLQMNAGGESFELQGTVSWVRDDAEAVGIRFVDVSPEDRLRLQRVVQRFKR